MTLKRFKKNTFAVEKVTLIALIGDWVPHVFSQVHPTMS